MKLSNINESSDPSYYESYDDIIQIVNNVRNELYESLADDDNIYPLTIIIDSEISIEFCGIEIWNSDNDEREYVDEENDIREHLENYLKKQINFHIIKLYKSFI